MFIGLYINFSFTNAVNRTMARVEWMKEEEGCRAVSKLGNLFEAGLGRTRHVESEDTARSRITVKALESPTS